LVKKISGAKVLFICDNIIPHERRLGDIVFTRYAFKQADHFIVQSDAVETELLKYFPDAIYRKVPHPVYENFGKAIPKEEARNALDIHAAKIILYFGYVRAYKGLLVLIEAMKQLKDITLLAVGEFYDDEAKYLQRVKALNLESNIRFVSDYVPNEQVAVYFSAADVVVLPYLSATQSGITQIAYNFDKPVIATDVGGLAEVIINEKTGFIVPPNDSGSLAAAIEKFYREEKENEFAGNVKIEKIKYSWENLILNIEDLTDGNDK
jgi:glycosyltransferase involved in cell wall biosynthesis